jgi:hypothetical protein
VATRSGDGGRTWRITGEIPCPRVPTSEGLETLLNESHALEIEPEHVLVVFRGSSHNCNIHLTRTYDGGCTWTTPADIGVFGYPSYLLRLQAGPILCVFGDRREPQAICGLLSWDQGATWDTKNPLTIRQFDVKVDMGYPVAIEVTPGEVLCVYYWMPGPGAAGYDRMDPRQAGILSTRFTLG